MGIVVLGLSPNTLDVPKDEPMEPMFRPRRWPLGLGLALNLLLASLFLVWPYTRGRLRAAHARRAFAQAAACVTGAEPANEPGVVLPERVWSDYAQQVESRPAGWPEICAPLLDRVAPPAAHLLFPGTKQAEEALREALTRTRTELSALDAPLALGARIPARPLEALERVAAALTLYARQTGSSDDLDHSVLREDAPTPVRPTRLPLDADTDAALYLSAMPGGLGVVGVGRRRVGWTRAQSGHVRAGGAHRPRNLRAAHMGAADFSLLWATSPERCAALSQGCRQRALGVSRGDFTATELTEPFWVAGHPFAAFDTSVRLRGHEGVELLALGATPGEIAWRAFERSDSNEGTAVRRSAREHGFEGATQATLLADGSVLWLDTSQAWRWQPSRESARLGALPPDAHGLRAQADGGASLWTQSALYGLDARHTLHRHEFPPSMDRPLRSALRAADAQGCMLLAHDAEGTLWSGTCEAGRWQPVARDVLSFSAAAIGGSALVALVRGEGGPARIVGLRAGAACTPIASPVPCFDRRGGFCGQPTMAVEQGRAVVITRDGGDILALETSDACAPLVAAQGL